MSTGHGARGLCAWQIDLMLCADNFECFSQATVSRLKSDMPGKASSPTASPQNRELLEWIMIRLWAIADRSQDPEVRTELMWFVNELTNLIEE
jgi:hypothetical protein